MGLQSPEQALDEFFRLFDKNCDGKITFEEYRQYYEDIGTLIQGTSSFKDLLNKTWGIDLDSCHMDKADVRKYVGMIREKLITSTSGVQDEFKLRNVFSSFGGNSNVLSKEDLDALLLKLNITVPESVLPKLFVALDKNNSGYIEFDEFENFVLYNPYK